MCIRDRYVIDKAHTMTPAAQNRLLKILEEPPEYLAIILLCDNISNVLPTILSRSIKIKLQKLTDIYVQKALEQNGYDEEKAKDIAKLAGGNIGYALKVAKDKKALNKYDEYKNIFFAIDNGMKIDAFCFLEKKRNEIGDILVCWQKILSNSIKLKSYDVILNCSQDEKMYVNKHKLDELVEKLDYILQTEIRLAANSQYLPTIDWLLSKL
jgi:DNA polymerase-3 subunit delta'